MAGSNPLDNLTDAQSGYGSEDAPAEVGGLPATDQAGLTWWEKALLVRGGASPEEIDAVASGDSPITVGPDGEVSFDLDLSSFVSPDSGQADTQWRTSGNEFMSRLHSDPQFLSQVQRRLFSLGYYEGFTPVYGKWDMATNRAISQFVGDATMVEKVVDENGNEQFLRLDLEDQLNLFVSEQADPDFEQEALSADPVGVMLANPERLDYLIEKAYGQAGVKPRTADKQAFTAAFHAMQRNVALANARAQWQMADVASGEVASGEPRLVELQAPIDEGIAAENFARQQVGNTAFDAAEAVPLLETVSRNMGPR